LLLARAWTAVLWHKFSPSSEFSGEVGILVCGFENLNPKLQSSIVPRDISNQVVAQLLLVSFAQQLRIEFLRPEQEIRIIPVLSAASFQL
jgi:hypothetical protein